MEKGWTLTLLRPQTFSADSVPRLHASLRALPSPWPSVSLERTASCWSSSATGARLSLSCGAPRMKLTHFRWRLRRWGRLFSSEEDVIALVATVLPLVAAFQLTDGGSCFGRARFFRTDPFFAPTGLSGATGGLLRGAGKAVSNPELRLASRGA